MNNDTSQNEKKNPERHKSSSEVINPPNPGTSQGHNEVRAWNRNSNGGMLGRKRRNVHKSTKNRLMTYIGYKNSHENKL